MGTTTSTIGITTHEDTTGHTLVELITTGLTIMEVEGTTILGHVITTMIITIGGTATIAAVVETEAFTTMTITTATKAGW